MHQRYELAFTSVLRLLRDLLVYDDRVFLL